MKDYCSCGHHKDKHYEVMVDGINYPTGCTELTYPRIAQSLDKKLEGTFLLDHPQVICGCLALDLDALDPDNVSRLVH